MSDFGDIYTEYREMVFGFLYRLCRNGSLAEEMTHETFYRAMKGWHRFRGDSSVFSWLCGIAKHLYFETLKKPPTVPFDETSAAPAPDIADSLAEKDRQMQAQHILHRLPEPYREVFTLRTFCDLSHRQIGELFSKSDNWARTTYYRARQMLQQAMKEAEET